MTQLKAVSASGAGQPVAGSADYFTRPMNGDAQTVTRPDGTKLRVVVDGTGPVTVLLVHGFAMSADAWSPVTSQFVAAGLRVIAYDQRGHGRSTCGAAGLTSGALRGDLKAVAAKFDLNAAILVCHSMGNFVALGALTDPDFSRRFSLGVMISPTTGNSAKGAPFVRLAAPMTKYGIMIRLASSSWMGTKLARMAVGRAASDELIEATRRSMMKIVPELAPLNRIMIQESVEGSLNDIVLPLHILTGADDTTTPGWHAEIIASKARNTRIDRIPGFGHMLPWENPDAVVAAVLRGSAA